jgi:hypothetical protein
MAIVTTLTFNSTAYDVSDYVMRHSIEIDEQLFNPDNLKPTTNRCDFKLSRSCPYIDELFAWTGDVEVSIVADGVAAFTGYLTDNYGLKITARGASDVSLSAEDPGIKKLKTAWVSTGALVTVFAGEKVCDPADTANSFVHILAGLAGVTLATTLPAISDTVYFSVQDKDKKQYWDILEKVLLDYRHVFYFDATGKLALFALDGLTGTASQYVCTNGTILQKSPGDPGVEIKKRLIQYKEVIVNFDEGETLASATVFRDTTGQGLTDCEIEIAAGAYYPTSCDASTYAYIDYFLEDGREIKAVDSITADFSLDSGITYELTNLGTSAQIRFYNPTGLARSIRKLKITGANVLAIKADSKVTSTVAGGKKLEYDAAYITELADAQSLANLLRYYYANSGSLYTFRAYAGTLYPADTLFPSDTLYPLGDIIALGDITRLHDPVWTGLDVNCGIYRKKYVVGKAGATFDAVGIGTITLSDAVSIYPIYQPNVQPPSSLPEIKAIADAAQAAAEATAIAAIPVYTPQYLGAHMDTTPTIAKEGDVYLLYSATPNTVDPPTVDDPPDHRGVFRYTDSAWEWTTYPGDIYKALTDIVFICQLKDPDGTVLYGAEDDYGITSTMETAHIMSAIIDRLRVGDLEIFGTLKSLLMDTINAQTGETISAPTPTYWPGSSLITLCSTLADGWHAVDSASTLDSKNITHAVKGGSDNSVSYQSSDAEVTGTYTLKTIVSAVSGKVTLFFDIKAGYAYDIYPRVFVNGEIIKEIICTSLYVTNSITFEANIGDSISISSLYWTASCKNFRLCPTTNTIGLWNNTDDSALSINNAGYYDESGTVNVNSGTLDTTTIDDYWLGSELIALFSGKVSVYRTIALGGGTFNSKTCSEIYYTPTYLKLTYSDTTYNEIYSDQPYAYTGSIILDDVEGKILLGDPDSEGQYELWSHNIPTTTNNILTVRNTKTSKPFSIWETRAPDTTVGNDSESTFSLHGVVGTADYVHDHSMHNYSGDMHFIDGFYNYGGDHVGDWKYVAKRTIEEWQPSTDYYIDEYVQNTGNVYRLAAGYIPTSAPYDHGLSAASGGPTGTGLWINDGTCYWTYIAVVSDNIWEYLLAQLDSNLGRLWLAGGRKPSGYLHDSYASHTDFINALVPQISQISTNQQVLVTGVVNTLTVSRMVRWESNSVGFYGMDGGTPTYKNYYSGGPASVVKVSIAW